MLLLIPKEIETTPINIICKTKCSEFDSWQFYRTTIITHRLVNDYECFCLNKEGKPVSLGIIKNERDVLRCLQPDYDC